MAARPRYAIVNVLVAVAVAVAAAVVGFIVQRKLHHVKGFFEKIFGR